MANSAFPDSNLPLLSYGTALPGSPVDGQEAVLVDSVTAPTYSWRFRYNAGSTSTYKWEFIGGSAQAAYEVTQVSAVAGSWNVFGPTLAVPRPGVYRLTHVSGAYSPSAIVLISGRWQTYPGGVAIPGMDIRLWNTPGTNNWIPIVADDLATITAAGSFILSLNPSGGAANTGYRQSTVIPVRVS